MMMIERWDYRYELIDFERLGFGVVRYQTREQGNLNHYHKPKESSRLFFKVQRTARELAEKTLKDVVVYVIGNRIIPRVRTINSPSFN